MRVFRVSLVAALGMAAVASAAWAGPARSVCASGAERRLTAELIFGRSVKNAPDVSEADFSDFLDKEVSARFPLGLTVTDAQGRWRSSDGTAVREPSKIVMIVLPGERGDLAKLDAVRRAYERQFHQEAVLQMTSPACVSF